MIDCIINSTTCAAFDFFPTCSDYFSTMNITISALDFYCAFNYNVPLRDTSLELCISDVAVLCANIPLTLSICSDVFRFFDVDISQLYAVCEPYTTTPTPTTTTTTLTTLPTSTTFTTTLPITTTFTKDDTFRDSSANKKELTWVFLGLLLMLYHL